MSRDFDGVSTNGRSPSSNAAFVHPKRSRAISIDQLVVNRKLHALHSNTLKTRLCRPFDVDLRSFGQVNCHLVDQWTDRRGSIIGAE
jgi:hypothetical protein